MNIIDSFQGSQKDIIIVCIQQEMKQILVSIKIREE